MELGVQNFSDKAAIVKSIHLHNFHCTSLLTQHSSTWLSLRTRRRRDKWPCTPNQRPLCKWQLWQVAREGPEKGQPVQPTLIPQGSGGSGFPNPGSTWVNWRFPQKSGGSAPVLAMQTLSGDRASAKALNGDRPVKAPSASEASGFHNSPYVVTTIHTYPDVRV